MAVGSSAFVTAARADDLIPIAKPMPGNEVASSPPGFISFCIRFPDQCAQQDNAAPIISLTPVQWLEMQSVNQSVNIAIRPMHDKEHYGRAEYWNIPSDGLGDCKDYALTKRQQLMAMGFPQPALRIAIVYTWKNERHAVLTVVTDHGDFVLDNLTDKIQSWDKADYRWIERQDPLDAWGWVSLEPLNNTRAWF